jgi:hypothetical protein
MQDLFSQVKRVYDHFNYHQTWQKHSLGTLANVYQILSNLHNLIKSYGPWAVNSD